MSSVRRLSKGSNVSLMDFESDDDLSNENEFGSKGINAMTKRRSSMGGGSRSKLNPTEQTRIADMYKTVIKLAAENKITAKNSWNLELIDHMGSLIKEDGGDRDNRGAVNFQKASCTLDASVKIYSHRVDDTWSSSFRILENLSRSNQSGEDDPDGEKNPARVGSKSVSNRLNLTSTIEKNISNLNGEALDCSHTADPMFHKMSQAFDEGGAKGMLMANLRVVPNTSSLVFTSEGAVASEGEQDTATMVDVSDIIMHAGFSPMSIADVPIAAALDNYREMIGVEPTMVGCLQTKNLTSSRDTTDITSITSEQQCAMSPQVSADNSQDFFCDDDDNDVCDMFDDDLDAGFEAVNVRRSSIISSPHRDQSKLLAGTPSKKFDPLYDAMGNDRCDFTDEDAPSAADSISTENKASIMIPSASAAGNEYSYFDASTLQNMGCNWAGARHWKMALRTAIKKTTDPFVSNEEGEDGVEVEETVEARREPVAKAKAKQPSRIDFTQGAVDVTSLLPPRGKRGGDPTCQTAGSVEKAIMLANGGALLLPNDAQFTAKDLCRLFLRPRLIVPPHDLKDHLKPALMRYNADSLQKVDNSSAVSSSLYGEKDFVWGSFAADVLAFSVNQNEPVLNMVAAMDEDNAYEDDDNGLYEGFGEDDDYDSPDGDVVEQMKGLAIDNNKLIQASRVVEKVNIGYATVAKRVNVKKLKHDLWNHLEDTLVTSDDPTVENEAPSDTAVKVEHEVTKKDNALSFQNVISDIAQEQKQKDVSLSFYFICLLHLANEKNFEISAVESMSDLRITKPT